MKKHPLALAVTIASLALVGCGSSGGGSKSPDPDQGQYEPQPEPTTPSPGQPSDEDTTPIPEMTLKNVRVGVADTGFDTNAIADNEKVVGSLNIYTNESDVNSGDIWHGTAVSSAITTATPGNARVDLIQVSDSEGITQSNALNYGLAVAAERNARVLNASYANRFRASNPALKFNGETAQESYNTIVNSNGGLGAVYVVGAGNNGEVMDVDSRPMYTEQPELWDMMLVAIGSELDGQAKHAESNFPGADTELQKRSLSTDYVNANVGAKGTSIATGTISAYAAGVIGMWPHITAQEASQLLLDTASKHSPLYDQNNCGTTGTMNCGYFYLGQGEADVDAALQPQGDLEVSVADRVDGERRSASETYMQLSSAYGDSLADSGALDNVAVFDALGRDYRMDLSNQAQQRTSYDRELQDRMSRMSITSTDHANTELMSAGMFQMQTSFNGYGDVVASRFDGEFGKAGFTAFNFGQGEASPVSMYSESGMIPMMSFQGGSDLTQSFDDVSGVKSSYSITDKLSMTASHWIGNTSNQENMASQYDANRTDVGMSFEATPEITVSSSFGVLNESEGLLGASSAGALSFGDNNLNFAGLTLDAQVANNISAFALFEQGFGEGTGNGLITKMDDISTREFAVGLQWSGKEKAAAFTIRQPMRLESGAASLNVPVGRTLNGDVITESRQASLAPSGRQIDFEIGYGFKPSTNSRMQVNLLHSLDPGHDANAPSDTAAMINYSLDW